MPKGTPRIGSILPIFGIGHAVVVGFARLVLLAYRPAFAAATAGPAVPDALD